MSGNVTLKEVAAEAGVHVSTASRALNPETRSVVSDQTAIRVLEVAEQLGYRPHPLARGLRTNRTLTVGMVVPDLMNPLFPPIYSGAESVLGDLGYSVLVASDAGDSSKTRAVIAALLDRRVDGLILANAHRDFSRPAGRETVPIVLVNRSVESKAFPAILGDGYKGIGLVVRHLTDLGHTEIAHIAGPQGISTGLKRRQAFSDWISRDGLGARRELIVEADGYRTDAGRTACETLLDSGARFTAIVAANDLIALGCYDALDRHGLSVPGDVSVTGYNDMTFVDRVAPPLTTVAVAYQEMGAAAARALLGLLAQQNTEIPPYDPILLTPELVIRASTSTPT